MRAAVLKRAPLLGGIPPQHQALAQQLCCMWPARVQVVHKRQGIPLALKIKLGRLLRMLLGLLEVPTQSVSA